MRRIRINMHVCSDIVLSSGTYFLNFNGDGFVYIYEVDRTALLFLDSEGLSFSSFLSFDIHPIKIDRCSQHASTENCLLHTCQSMFN